MSFAPPRIAEWLLRRAAPRGEAEFVAGDMHEEFDSRAAAAGVGAARRWYWMETVCSLAPLALRRLTGGSSENADRRRSDSVWSSVIGDARHAMRLSARSPLASVAIVATMVLGVGSTTAVFSAMNAVLLRPLPFPHSERVIELQGTLRDGRVVESLAYPDLMDFRRSVTDIAELALYSEGAMTLQHGATPLFLHTIDTDEGYARVFGIRPLRGRLLAASDAAVNAPRVTVLSHAFWQREFGGDPAVVGSTIKLNDESVLVVGVLAPGAYTYPRTDADALLPLVIEPNSPMTRRGSMWAGAAALMRPGSTIEQTRLHLASAAALLATQNPDANAGIGAYARPLHEAVVGSVESMLQLLAAAVAAVLLIACLNIANLILGRAQARSREFAVRSALGGTPSRVRRQVLTESLVLALIGGGLGVAIAPTLTHALIAVYPDSLPRADEIDLSVPVIVIAALATALAGILSAWPTARRAARLDLANDLRDGGRSGGGRAERRAGSILIVAQVAASLALVFSAGLLLQTFQRLTRVDPGFDAEGLTSFHVFAPEARYRNAADITRYYAGVTTALRGIPGVRAVSAVSMLPFAGGWRGDVFIQDEKGDQSPRNPSATVSFADADFQRTLGVRLLRGRAFTAADDSASAPVVMINEAIAQQHYAGVDPVGHTILWNGKRHSTIVGVVASTHLQNLWDESGPVLYVSALQYPRRGRYVIVRSTAPPGQVLAAARTALRGLDPTIALTDPAPMRSRISRSLGAQRFRATLMAALGALALALALIGIYSVVAYTVARRTREIGIRMALGEGAGNVGRRVVRDTVQVAAAGIALGGALSLAAGKWLSVFLIGVSAYDLTMLASAAAALLLVVLGAAYGPARRAARVDPVAALRGD